MSDDNKTNKNKSYITPKKEIFAQTLVLTGDEETALDEAGYSKNKHVREKRRYMLRRDPFVLKRIGEILGDKYPNHEHSFASLLKKADDMALESTNIKDILGVLEFHAKIKGYLAPTKTVNARLPTPPLDLMPIDPIGEDDDG